MCSRLSWVQTFTIPSIQNEGCELHSCYPDCSLIAFKRFHAAVALYRMVAMEYTPLAWQEPLSSSPLHCTYFGVYQRGRTK
mmetsp:Transcript_49224/g.87900  ORF Transcript_49224/g.87900 Transcript_49224/m.87900 type:complete len:81 (+) Transcript_49224:1307-1549(+)